MLSWLYVIVAILLEVVATTCMKLSEGFSKLLPSILMFVFYGLCFTILTFALKKIELGIVYAVWSGLGTVSIAAIGIFLLNESASPIKMVAILLIITGVVILQLNSEQVIDEEQGRSDKSVPNLDRQTTELVKTQDKITIPENVAPLESQVSIKTPDIEKKV